MGRPGCPLAPPKGLGVRAPKQEKVHIASKWDRASTSVRLGSTSGSKHWKVRYTLFRLNYVSRLKKDPNTEHPTPLIIAQLLKPSHFPGFSLESNS
jgi:hypothetical protein